VFCGDGGILQFRFVKMGKFGGADDPSEGSRPIGSTRLGSGRYRFWGRHVSGGGRWAFESGV